MFYIHSSPRKDSQSNILQIYCKYGKIEEFLRFLGLVYTPKFHMNPQAHQNGKAIFHM